MSFVPAKLLASFLTAMETWLVGCLVFVFLALIEYGVVLHVMSATKEKTLEIEDEAKVKKKHKTLIKTLQVWQRKTRGVAEINAYTEGAANTATVSNGDATTTSVAVGAGGGELATKEELRELEDAAERKGQKLDKIALVVLPILYIIFNVVYWIHYMY